MFNRNKLASYTEVSRQNVYLEGTNLIYEIFIGRNSVKVPISNLEPSTIRLLDTMMNSSRSIRIDSDVIKEVVAKKIYTEERSRSGFTGSCPANRHHRLGLRDFRINHVGKTRGKGKRNRLRKSILGNTN